VTVASGASCVGWYLGRVGFREFHQNDKGAKMAKSRDAAKERYWRGVIRRLEASGLGPRRFCKRQRLPEHRLHWWRRRLRGDQGRSRRPSGTRGGVRDCGDRRKGSAFLPVGIPFSVGGPIEVVHPRGHVIRVPAIFDAATLGHILAAIDGPAGASGSQ
jgi:hypothetical protein